MEKKVSKEIFSVRDLTLGYRSSGGVVGTLVTGLSVDSSAGHLTALVGRNGVGKSTLLRVMAGVAKPLQGDVLLGGRSVLRMKSSELARLVSFVSTENVSVAHLMVWDVVAMGRAPYTGWFGGLSDVDKVAVRGALLAVGMLDFADKTLDSLSDGERARVMIGRALAQDTPLMLLDEPTAFLDLPNRYQIALLLKKLAHTTGKSIIFSSHDLSTAIQLCDSMWVMSRAGVVCGTPRVLIDNQAFAPIFEGTDIVMDPVTALIRVKSSVEGANVSDDNVEGNDVK